MSRSFGVNILLPLDGYNSDEIYAENERLQRINSDKKDGKYYKQEKIQGIQPFPG